MQNLNDKFIEVKCPLCDSEKYIDFLLSKDFYNNLPGTFSTSYCLNCGFIFTNPRPKTDTLHELYPDNAGYLTPKKVNNYSNSEKNVLNKYFSYSIDVSRKTLSPITKTILTRKLKIQSVPKFVEDGNLLDIGASYGDYLSKMKSIGWKCKGIELNSSSAKYAREVLSLDVDECLIEDYNPPIKYDVINLGMVLEHVLYPKETLTKIYTLLKDNGQFILSIPNIYGIEAKLFKKYWYSLHLPMHLNHFSKRRIIKLLNDVGFQDVQVYFQPNTNDIIGSLKYLSIEKRFFKPIFKLLSYKYFRKIAIEPLSWCLSILGLTSRMTIHVKKIKI